MWIKECYFSWVNPMYPRKQRTSNWVRVKVIGRELSSSSINKFSSVQSLSHVRLLETPWTAACQASLSIESVMPSKHLILCHPLLLLPSIFPSIRVFSDESVFISGGQSIGMSASASVLPTNIQDWFPLGWTGWLSLLSKGLSGVFSNTTVQKRQFFSAQLSL